MLQDKRDLPLHALSEFIELKKVCKDLSFQESRVLNVDFANFYIRLTDRTSGGRFHYTIDNPRLDGNSKKPVVSVKYRPQNHVSNGEYSALLEVSQVKPSIDRWLELIKAYDQLSLDPADRFLNQYTDEIYVEILLPDGDSATTPLNDKQQRLLTYILDGIEEALEVVDIPDSKKAELISESNSLKENIPQLTQNQALGWTAKLFAKIKLLGQKNFEKIKDEAWKLIIKTLVDRGFDFLKDQWPHLIHFLHS